MSKLPNPFRNSTPAFIVAALLFAVSSTCLVFFLPEVAAHSARVFVAEGAAIAGWTMLGWGFWLFKERKIYEGWFIEVANLDETTERDPIPPSVIKQWIQAHFSDWGPHGWRDICATLDPRDNGCAPIWVDARKAKRLGALRVDYAAKVVYVSYIKMGPPTKPRPFKVPLGPDQVVEDRSANGTASVTDTTAVSGS
jgi:hypothetical protein